MILYIIKKCLFNINVWICLFSKVWLSLAENYIRDLRIDWEKTVKFVFNERSNPDDHTLGLQIVKVGFPTHVHVKPLLHL